MELVNISGTDLMVSRVALGTWAIGGWMWGGTDEKQSIKTIHMALDKGINLIDTAPVYGFGLSEKIVGKAIKEYGNRDKLHIATKVALEWKDGKVFRNSTPERIEKEVMASLERLQTDYIDIYFIHWPDSLVPFEKTAETMKKLLDDGVIRAIGVSNYSADQMNQFRKAAPIHVCQPPYNIFERQIEDNEKPYCHEHKITMMAYGALCRGLLSGKMSKNRAFKGDDLRKADPKFQGERFDQYLAAAEKIQKMADNQYGKDLLSTAIRWVLDQGIEIAIWGARTPEQLKPVDDIIGWSLNEADKSIIDDILAKTIKNPVGPEFMAPPERDINK
jgi:aryl-alcohol dehydrogenase-like predicted oxidoreductase